MHRATMGQLALTSVVALLVVALALAPLGTATTPPSLDSLLSLTLSSVAINTTRPLLRLCNAISDGVSEPPLVPSSPSSPLSAALSAALEAVRRADDAPPSSSSPPSTLPARRAARAMAAVASLAHQLGASPTDDADPLAPLAALLRDSPELDSLAHPPPKSGSASSSGGGSPWSMLTDLWDGVGAVGRYAEQVESARDAAVDLGAALGAALAPLRSSLSLPTLPPSSSSSAAAAALTPLLPLARDAHVLAAFLTALPSLEADVRACDEGAAASDPATAQALARLALRSASAPHPSDTSAAGAPSCAAREALGRRLNATADGLDSLAQRLARLREGLVATAAKVPPWLRKAMAADLSQLDMDLASGLARALGVVGRAPQRSVPTQAPQPLVSSPSSSSPPSASYIPPPPPAAAAVILPGGPSAPRNAEEEAMDVLNSAVDEAASLLVALVRRAAAPPSFAPGEDADDSPAHGGTVAAALLLSHLPADVTTAAAAAWPALARVLLASTSAAAAGRDGPGRDLSGYLERAVVLPSSRAGVLLHQRAVSLAPLAWQHHWPGCVGASSAAAGTGAGTTDGGGTGGTTAAAAGVPSAPPFRADPFARLVRAFASVLLQLAEGTAILAKQGLPAVEAAFAAAPVPDTRRRVPVGGAARLSPLLRAWRERLPFSFALLYPALEEAAAFATAAAAEEVAGRTGS
jgi:hypothetical protein